MWYSKSLLLQKGEYSLWDGNVDLTVYSSNWEWGCKVTDYLTYDQIYCTRQVPTESDFDTGQIRYGAGIVVNAVGYRWSGSETQ